MRIDEISDHNRVLAFLADLKIDYQPAWLQVKHLLDFYVISGDPVDAKLVAMCDSMDKEFSYIQSYVFDPNDADLPQLLHEVNMIRAELSQYRHTLGI